MTIIPSKFCLKEREAWKTEKKRKRKEKSMREKNDEKKKKTPCPLLKHGIPNKHLQETSPYITLALGQISLDYGFFLDT